MALGERKRKIVSAIVDTYIRTGEPVGSKVLAVLLDNAVSSATIRNDMAELTAQGYLEQPHTSAGRIPTVKAFRLYIDHLMARRPLDPEQKRAMDAMLEKASGDPDRLIAEASEVLAQVTGCAAMAASPDQQEFHVRQIQILPTGSRSAAVLLMTDAGGLQSRVCRLDVGSDPAVLEQVTERLNREFAGKALSSIRPVQVQSLILQLLGGHGLLYAPVLTAFLELVQDSAEAEVRLSGEWNLLRHPEYQSDRARQLLGFLSRREQLIQMLAAPAGGLSVLLGGESLRPELNGSSIIITRYTSGAHDGSLGLLGPLRMDYAEAIPQLEYVAQTVGRMLTELFEEK